jgi:hypothetical protein
LIDSQQASEALNEIDEIARRVRQSSIYQLASLMLIMWGALTAAGYLVTYLLPRHAGFAWIAIYVAGIAGSFAISTFGYPKTRIRIFDSRTLVAVLLFIAFGFFIVWLGRFTPRQIGTFWPVYYMMVYTIVGLWVGYAFVAIGLGITALTLIGYFFIGDVFDVWMAIINGGGLILGGLWMRRS